jgi:isopenicillin-N N-acyltransferase-like protein
MDRREFLVQAGVSGLSGLVGGACVERHRERQRAPRPRAQRRRSRPAGTFAVVEARGTPFEVGAAMGAAARGRIHRLIGRRGKWFADLKRFALKERAQRVDGFVAAVKKHHPDIWAELKGIAKGAQRPLDDILVLNLQPELSGLRHQCGCGNCSTLHLVDGKRVLLAHNEDDHDASRDLMLVVRARPRGKPSFVSLAYPGVLPGNVPAMTSAGLVQTTNYIGAARVQVGVPRYVVGRSLLSARSMDEAVNLARTRHGAYSFNVNLGSRPEGRLVSMELGPGGVFDLRETRGEVYVHTNHYLLPKTRGKVPEIRVPPGGSSDSRYRILKRAVAKLPALERVGPDTLLRLLASHAAIRQPFSPCRHPKGAVQGRTVATALFDVTAGTFSLYEGNPCEGRRRQLRLP